MPPLSELLRHATHIEDLVRLGGYSVLFAIIFSETGLMIGFFLPGDSLLVTAGLLAASGTFNVGFLIALLVVAAITGDATGYAIGHRLGRRLFEKPDSRWFKRKHLITTQLFYERHGGKTIVMARFVPIVRTFAPVVAGVARMKYRRFASFNVFGGTGWVASMIMTGYLLGRVIPGIGRHVEPVVGVVILLSLVPPFVSSWKERRRYKLREATFLKTLESIIERIAPVRWEWSKEKLQTVIESIASPFPVEIGASGDQDVASHVRVDAEVSGRRSEMSAAAFEHAGWEFERKFNEAVNRLGRILAPPTLLGPDGGSDLSTRHEALRVAVWPVHNGQMLLVQRKDPSERHCISIVVEPAPDLR